MGRLGKVMLVAWRAQYLPGTQGVFDELCLLFLSWAAPWSHPPFQALYNPKKRYLSFLQSNESLFFLYPNSHPSFIHHHSLVSSLIFSKGWGWGDWGFGTEHAPMSFLLFPRPVYSKEWASVLSSSRWHEIKGGEQGGRQREGEFTPSVFPMRGAEVQSLASELDSTDHNYRSRATNK